MGAMLTSCTSSRTLPPTCATANSSYLPDSSFGTFVLYVHVHSSHPPTGRLPGTVGPLWTQGFVENRLIGYMNVRALRHPFIGQERAKARSLRYPTNTKWPLTPLSGKVVIQTPGLLEVYQTHTLFRSQRTALSLINSIRATAGGVGVDHVNGSIDKLGVLPHIPGVTSSYEFFGSFGTPSPGTEHVVGVGLLMNSVVAQYSFQGGRNVTPKSVLPYVLAGARRLRPCA